MGLKFQTNCKIHLILQVLLTIRRFWNKLSKFYANAIYSFSYSLIFWTPITTIKLQNLICLNWCHFLIKDPMQINSMTSFCKIIIKLPNALIDWKMKISISTCKKIIMTNYTSIGSNHSEICRGWIIITIGRRKK